MIGIFKQKTPGNNLLLLIYGLVLKFPFLLHPAGPVRQPHDHYLYIIIFRFLDPLTLPPFFFGFFSFLLLMIQAVLFNRICNAHKMLAKSSYLPGMAYLLLSSLFREWNQFSSALLINMLLIWIFYKMLNLYNTNKPLAAIFNIGLLMGAVTLLYQPAIVFILLIPFSLYIMRAFRIREWLVGFLGVTTPYYFLALEPLFTNQWQWNYLVPHLSFDLPAMPSSGFVTVSIVLLVIPFIVGGFFVQDNLNKMLIQVRKSWSLLLLFLMISLLIILMNGGYIYVNWIFCLIPLTAFHAAAYFYPANKTFPLVLHWITFAYAMYINYWL